MSIQKLSAKPFYEALLFNIQRICKENNVDDTHGLAHAVKIGSQTEKALFSQQSINITEIDIENVTLAAYLHDIDDRKFFITNDYSNATQVLKGIAVDANRIKEIIEMIDLVSFSKNGNHIRSQIPAFYYLPRYVDRSEAIGVQGLYRSYAYNTHKKQKQIIYDEQTPKPKFFDEALQFAQGRDKIYMKSGKSRTVIDHFFDKLIHIELPKEIQNAYLRDLYKRKQKQMIDFIIFNGYQGYINYQANLLKQYELHKHDW